jgi:Glycosyl hydrolase family 26
MIRARVSQLIRASRRASGRQLAARRSRVLRIAMSAALAAAVAQLTACTGSPSFVGTAASNAPGGVNTSASSTADAHPTWAPMDPAKPQPVPGKVLLGAYLSLSGMTEQQAQALRRQQLGENFGIIHRYYAWSDDLPRAPRGMTPGTTLMISWSGAKYATILNGSQDRLITRAADNLRGYKKPVFLRWAWEMNGSWYAWGGSKNNSAPNQFIAAWRHIHDIFVKEKANNVAFVWSPNTFSDPAEPWNDMSHYYPGDGYVDWVGISGYFTGRQTPDDLFHEFATYGDRKPLMIAETGSQEHGGTVKADWIRALEAWIIAHPAIAALVWFDTDNDRNTGKNWRIDSSPSALQAYQEMANDPRFVGVGS